MSMSPGRLFADEFHDEFGMWMLGYTPFGGGDWGEVATVAAAVGDGDDGAFFDAWMAAGDMDALSARDVTARMQAEHPADMKGVAVAGMPLGSRGWRWSTAHSATRCRLRRLHPQSG